MSVAEIKVELRRLTPEDRREIREIIAIDFPKADDAQRAEEFSKAKAHVFEHYGPLLQRLAGIEVRTVNPTDPDVSAATDRVFEKHHDLLRRLAE